MCVAADWDEEETITCTSVLYVNDCRYSLKQRARTLLENAEDGV